MRIFKNVFKRWNDFLLKNNFVRNSIRLQHRLLPMPLVIFDAVFRSSLCRKLFNFYGSHVANYPYLKRGGDQLGFWLSKDSLYWHFWRQTDTNDQIFKEILAIESVKNVLTGAKDLVVVEQGFGIGKNYAKFFRPNNKFARYIAVEPNKYLCDYVAKKFRSDENFEVVNASVADFIKQKMNFDVLFCSGGVFMYLNPVIVDELFRHLGGVGVRSVVILNEGTPKEDTVRDDGTIMFNFKNRLLSVGYQGKRFLEKEKQNNIYSYFIMY